MIRRSRSVSSVLVSSLLVALLAVMLSASAARAGDVSSVSAVLSRGELVVLTWPHQESVFTRRLVKEFQEDGLCLIGGVDIDVMKLFADHLGVALQVKPVTPDFAALIPSLLAGEGDVVASSMTITPVRSQRVEFSVPYFEVHKVVIARRNEPLREVTDLADMVASVAHGTSHEEQLLALFPQLEIRPVRFMLENYLAVAEGQADFTIVDSSSAERVLKEYADLGRRLVPAFHFPESDYFGFAVAPGNDLRASLDLFIEEIRQNGELDRILDKHLNPPKAPADRGPGTVVVSIGEK